MKEKILRRILLLAVVLTVLFIVATDAGNHLAHKSGAGDIWWTGVEEVETAWQKLNGR